MKTVLTSFLRSKGNFLICMFLLLILIIFKFPFDISVVCANENEGFSFVYGQNFSLWHTLTPGRGPLFILIYALILKIFGFNTYSIIAVHFVVTIISALIGILLFLIISRLNINKSYTFLSLIIYIILINTPIGKATLPIEIRSHHALEPEYFCVLFSLCSVFCLVFSNFYSTNTLTNHSIKKIFIFFAGVFAVCSFMSKTSGLVLTIATIIWFGLLVFKKEQNLKLLLNVFSIYCLGLIFSFICFNVFLYFSCDDLILFWKEYFLIGAYNQNYLTSFSSLLNSVYNFMTRYTSSYNNLILFTCLIFFSIWGLVRGYFIKDQSNLSTFWSLISIVSFGSIAVIITPGEYQPYYYHLIWTYTAIIFILGIHDLFALFNSFNLQFAKYLLCITVSLFFIYRVSLTIPTYNFIFKALHEVSIFNQPLSFKDPISASDLKNSNRVQFLKTADALNILLPDKNNTVYIFNFGKSGFSNYIPPTYIYAKRYPPTTIDCNLLKVNVLIEGKLNRLKKDLLIRSPDILVISKDLNFTDWQIEKFTPFLNWFKDFLSERYYLLGTYELVNSQNTTESEFFNIFKKRY